jgi:hypothetical protein
MTDPFRDLIEKEYKAYVKSGYCKIADKINQAIGEEYFDTANPHFFTGNPQADIVTIMLNPKRDNKEFKQQSDFDNFDDYWNHYRYFGKNRYGNVNRMKKEKNSRFDLNQRLFLRNLGVIDFVDEKNNADILRNLEKAIDNKLQWELVPYGSPNFDFRKIGIFHLKQFLDKTIEIISMHERKRVFFCGAVFRDLAWFENVEFVKNHKFKLIKNNGRETRDFYEMITINIHAKNKVIKAVVLPQYARQGGPLEAYAKKIKELY